MIDFDPIDIMFASLIAGTLIGGLLSWWDARDYYMQRRNQKRGKNGRFVA